MSGIYLSCIRNPDIGTARVSDLLGILGSTNGNEDFGRGNVNTPPIPSCDASHRDRNFCRLAYQVGERLSALSEPATLPNNFNDCHWAGNTNGFATLPLVLLCRLSSLCSQQRRESLASRLPPNSRRHAHTAAATR